MLNEVKSLEERKIACSNPGIKDKVIIEKFIEAFNEFVDTKQISVDAQPLQEELNKLFINSYLSIKTKNTKNLSQNLAIIYDNRLHFIIFRL